MAETPTDLLLRHIRDVPDFPTPGILFKDIAPLLADSTAFAAAVTALATLAADGPGPVDLVAGIEARGFILAGPLARELGIGMVPVRKAGKLPPPTVRRSYQLEYGSAEIEVPLGSVDGKRVLIVDDVLATGGTLEAAIGLLTEAGATVTGVVVLLELVEFGGRSRCGDVPVKAVLEV